MSQNKQTTSNNKKTTVSGSGSSLNVPDIKVSQPRSRAPTPRFENTAIFCTRTPIDFANGMNVSSSSSARSRTSSVGTQSSRARTGSSVSTAPTTPPFEFPTESKSLSPPTPKAESVKKLSVSSTQKATDTKLKSPTPPKKESVSRRRYESANKSSVSLREMGPGSPKPAQKSSSPTVPSSVDAAMGPGSSKPAQKSSSPTVPSSLDPAPLPSKTKSAASPRDKPSVSTPPNAPTSPEPAQQASLPAEAPPEDQSPQTPTTPKPVLKGVLKNKAKSSATLHVQFVGDLKPEPLSNPIFIPTVGEETDAEKYPFLVDPFDFSGQNQRELEAMTREFVNKQVEMMEAASKPKPRKVKKVVVEGPPRSAQQRYYDLLASQVPHNHPHRAKLIAAANKPSTLGISPYYLQAKAAASSASVWVEPELPRPYRKDRWDYLNKKEEPAPAPAPAPTRSLFKRIFNKVKP